MTPLKPPPDIRSVRANAEPRPGNPDCTGIAETCQRDHGECLTCGERDCPGGEPLHYHHDGCPLCDGEFGGEPYTLDDVMELWQGREVES